MSKRPYPKNFGLINDDRSQDLKKKDYILGGASRIGNAEVLQPDGHGWKAFLPALEMQYGHNFDTFACVTFSALNQIETIAFRKYGVKLNRSDRFTAKASGTIPGSGNSLFIVAESIRVNDGTLDEPLWPFPRTDNDFDVNDFYADLPANLKLQAKDFFKNFKIKWEWVPLNISNMLFALQYAPLQVTGFAWDPPVNGLYQKTTKDPNHAFLLYDYVLNQKWLVYDQYDNDFKELAWDYAFGAALKFDVERLMQLNAAFLAELRNRGLRYIQRPQAHGEVYRLDLASITFLDSKPDMTGHTPLYDEVIHVLVSENKLVGLSEADYTKLITP